MCVCEKAHVLKTESALYALYARCQSEISALLCIWPQSQISGRFVNESHKRPLLVEYMLYICCKNVILKCGSAVAV